MAGIQDVIDELKRMQASCKESQEQALDTMSEEHNPWEFSSAMIEDWGSMHGKLEHIIQALKKEI